MSGVWRIESKETLLRFCYRRYAEGDHQRQRNLSDPNWWQFAPMKQKPTKPKRNILREIQADKVLPVYLLCGEESFLIEGTLKQMLDHLLSSETRDFNLTFLDGTDITTREILSQVDLYPCHVKMAGGGCPRCPLFLKSSNAQHR